MGLLAKLGKSMVPAILGALILPLLCAASDNPAKPSPVLPAEHAADERSLQNARVAITAFSKETTPLCGFICGEIPTRRYDLSSLIVLPAVSRFKQSSSKSGELPMPENGRHSFSASVDTEIAPSTSTQRQIVALLLDLYRTDPDAEVHSAIDWLLGGAGGSHLNWNRRAALEKIDRKSKDIPQLGMHGAQRPKV